MTSLRILPLALILCTAAASAQAPLPSREVHPDGTVTFRYTAKSATSVAVAVESLPAPLPMTRDDNGVWSVTTPVLAPQIYGYGFRVDGNLVLDVANPDLRTNYLFPSNNLVVPATPPAPWEETAIPHGRLDQHVFTSRVLQNYPQNQAPYIVYTPPGYEARRKGGYPVLYLLHGYTDQENGWTNAGHAQFMLDSMIAEGKAVPMIVVMPLGYGDLNFVLGGFHNWDNVATVDNNVALYSQALLTEIMPAVEHDYNTAHGREHRAIAGLSMGGLESLTLGLKHPELFAYVGGFSSALRQQSNFDTLLPGVDAKKANLKLLWIACGVSDGLLQPNVDFIAWARRKGYGVTAIQTPGAHTWLVWRDNLLHFAPLLFR